MSRSTPYGQGNRLDVTGLYHVIDMMNKNRNEDRNEVTVPMPIPMNEYAPPTPVEMYDPQNPFIVPREKPIPPSIGQQMQGQNDIIIPRDKPTPPTRDNLVSTQEGEGRGNIFQRLGKALSDENVRDRLIMGLQSLKAEPNKLQIAMANERLQGRKDVAQRNRTAEYIMQLTGDENMAKAVADGAITPKDAISMFQKSITTEQDASKKMAQYNSILNETGSPLLAKEVLQGARTQESATEIGNQAKSAIRTERDTVQLVKTILGHENFDDVFGWLQGRLLTLDEGTAEAEQLLFQLGSQQFLDAFQSLRGGGQISNIEGAKATAARNALFDKNGELRTTVSEKFAREQLQIIQTAAQRIAQEYRDKYGIKGSLSTEPPITQSKTSQGVGWSFSEND